MRREHPEALLVLGDINAAPFRAGVFDTIYSIYCLEHIFYLDDAVAADALVAFLEASKARNEWPGELAAQKALQQIAGTSSPRTAERWRRFVEELREGGD